MPAEGWRKSLSTDPEKLVQKLAGLGLTQKDIADCLPVSERTLRYRLEEDEDLRAAYDRGRAQAKEAMLQRHSDIAMGRAGFEEAPVKDQARALEWQMERLHGLIRKEGRIHEGGLDLEHILKELAEEDGGSDEAA